MISTTNEPRGALTGRSSILAVLADSGPFHGLLLTILAHFGVPERFSRLTIPRVRLPVGHQHSQFWPILARFMDYYSLFWGLGVISMIDEPQGTLTCRSSTLIVLADSGPFMDYYSLSWGLGVISKIDEPKDALKCRSPTLAVLPDSGPFHGLLLTVLGSRSVFHD